MRLLINSYLPHIVIIGLTSFSVLFFSSKVLAAPSDSCSIIGNNLAVSFSSGQEEIDEGEYTLAILNDAGDKDTIINSINNYNGTVIVRVGASTTELGPPKEEYARILNEIASAVAPKEFIAMANHNEANGQEGPTACRAQGAPSSVCNVTAKDALAWTIMQLEALKFETAFASYVTGNVTASNVRFITGQFDNYFNSSPDNDNSNTVLFAQRIIAAGNGKIEGVALPLYTTPAFPTGIDAFNLLQNTYNQIGGVGLFVTESGPFADYDTGFISTFDEYLIAVQETINANIVDALLLFNSHGINEDPLFEYTRPFHSAACRQALRNSCQETEIVLAACDGLFAEGDHLCTTFCKGDSANPCQGETEANNCSYPIDFSKILSPDLEDEDQQIAASYMSQYLKNTKVGKGKTYELESRVLNPETCDTENEDPGMLTAANDSVIRNSLCAQQEGEGFVYFGTEDRTINAINPPNRRDESSLRADWSRGVFVNNIASRLEGFGSWNQSSTPEQQIKYMSAVVALKNECWNETLRLGNKPIADYMDNDVFGKVRCMNFQDWSDEELGTERDVFVRGELRSCLAVYYASDKDSAIGKCQKDLNDLYKNNPRLYKKVMELPQIPIATFPLIAGIDEYGPEFEDGGLQNTVAQIIGRLQESGGGLGRANLNMLKSAAGIYGDNNRLGALGTAYIITPIIAGQDTKIAAQSMNDLTHAPEAQANYQIEETNNPLEALFNLIISAFDFLEQIALFYTDESPYWYERIPEELREVGAIVATQTALHRNFENCLDEVEYLDKSLNDAEVPSVGALGFNGRFRYEAGRGQAAETGYANISNTIRSLVEFGQGTNFTSQRFVLCELYPKELDDVDVMAHSISNSFSSPGFQKAEIVRDGEKKIRSDFTAEGEAETFPPVLQEDGKRFNPPGSGDNLGVPLNEFGACPINTFLEGELCYGYPVYDNYCSGPGYPDCPPGESRVVMDLKSPEDSTAERDKNYTILSGGNSLLQFAQNLSLQAFRPPNVSYKNNVEDNDNEYFCNRMNNADDPSAIKGIEVCGWITDEPTSGGKLTCDEYESLTTIIPSREKLKEAICQASDEYDVPGFVLRSLFSIEGGEAIAAFNSGRFGEEVSCQISSTGDVGPMQINVPACGGESGNDILPADCSMEEGIRAAAKILSQKEYFVSPRAKGAWDYEYTWRVSGYYNGGGNKCISNPTSVPGSVSGNPNVGTLFGSPASYCRYATEAFDGDSFWSCPGDPVLGPRPAGWDGL